MNAFRFSSKTLVRHMVSLGAVIVLATAALAGCAGQEPSTESGTAQPSPAATPPLDPGSASEYDGCDPTQGPHASNDPVAGGVLHPEFYAEIRDLGKREHAMGEATSNEEGLPATYTAVANDVEIAIAARFCLTTEDLHLLNFVRHCVGDTIQPGDVYNLDPYTIATVGQSVNGLCNNTPTFTLPER
ncbi:hypothetical protein ACTJKH_07300 [Microbacterium sp. 22215]|uniref:hypothetical protein n=1 Tax=Microbacterium sp. 22215 TaxID=3453893 RepID=UPI003F870CF1